MLNNTITNTTSNNLNVKTLRIRFRKQLHDTRARRRIPSPSAAPIISLRFRPMARTNKASRKIRNINTEIKRKKQSNLPRLLTRIPSILSSVA